MGMQVRFCVFVDDGDGVVVVDIFCEGGHWVVSQGSLKRRRHEIVARSRMRENRKVQPKPKEIYKEGEENKREKSGTEMTNEFALH